MPVLVQLQLLCWYWYFIVMPYAADAKIAPEITEGPVDVTEFVDNRLMMSCAARGDPRPTIQWQKRNGTGGRWMQVSRASERYKVQRSGNLVIRRLLASDAGLFRCVAENTVGSSYSTEATLVVQAPAQIVEGPRDFEVVWGTEVVLECEVVGIPFPSRSWTKNGKVIMNRQTHTVTSQARLRINATESAGYSCRAENVHRLGRTNVSRSAYVRVLDSRCVTYNGAVCRHVFGVSSSVYVPAFITDAVAVADSAVQDQLSRLTPQCRNVTLGTLCRYAYPDCAGTAGVAKSKPLCRESCDALLQSSCLAGIEKVSFPNCTSLPSRNSSEPCSAVELKNVTGETTAESEIPFQPPSANEVVIAVLVSVPVGLLLSVVIIVVIRKKHAGIRCQKPAVSSPPLDSVDIDITCLPLNDAYVPPQSTPPDSEYSSLLSPLEYARNGLQFCEDLRPGAFGPIFMAHAPGIASRSTTTVPSSFVVVKALRSDTSDEARRDFIRIGELLSRLVHPNIVRLLGVCLSASPLCLIVEYMPGRDLCEFLQESAPQHFIVRHGRGTSATRLKSADLIGAARQIASAMVYVSECGFVHRDLAARNCLVGDRNAPRLEVKLSDFGLAVELGDRDFHCGDEDEEIPVRWMPPEAVRENRFTHASDVWSFGVLMWEIFTYGMQPYEQMTIKEVIRFVDSGRTLNCPEHASNAVYLQMQSCWHRDPNERPQFKDLLKQLSTLEDIARADIRFS